MAWAYLPGVCRRRCPQRCVPASDVANDSIAECRLLCALPWCGLSRCRGRRRKEKGPDDEEDDLDGLELGERVGNIKSDWLANAQDADEIGVNPAATADTVPSWQMPKLIVECSQRPGARVHKGTSLILPEAGGDLMAGIVANLPVLLQIKPCWHLGYSMAVDGVSLRTLYRQVADVGPCMIIVEDSNSCIFGAFLSEGLGPANQCYGSHECFVFRYPRTAGAWRAEVYMQTSPQSQGAAPCAAAVAAAAEAAAAAAEGESKDVGSDSDEPGPATTRRTEHRQTLRRLESTVGSAPSYRGVFCDHTGIVIGIDGPGLFIDQDLLRGVSWPSKSFGSPCLPSVGPDFVVRNLEVWHWADIVGQ
eukprot:TRINITY_DN91609_c0_g1_i1.p1 TRINITY_DN91609_c0_g1~~TRINITY_DN91609_c0_g1_i1.p1  ORF type:complete len:362 (+),score=44.74 TRINITY_DN91609_c0_g1_i1:74-1159(+)